MNSMKSAAAMKHAAPPVSAGADDWANELPTAADLAGLRESERDVREGRVISHAVVKRRLKRFIAKLQRERDGGLK